MKKDKCSLKTLSLKNYKCSQSLIGYLHLQQSLNLWEKTFAPRNLDMAIIILIVSSEKKKY